LPARVRIFLGFGFSSALGFASTLRVTRHLGLSEFSSEPTHDQNAQAAFVTPPLLHTDLQLEEGYTVAKGNAPLTDG